MGKAGVTARQFAALVGLNPNSITNYAGREEMPSHLAIIVTLMAEMAEGGLDFSGPLARLRIEPNKPRGGGAKGKFGGSKQMTLRLG